MLDYSELTIVKNTDGITTALGYPINSILLQNNKPLFAGGGGKKKVKKHHNKDVVTEEETNYDQLAVPTGLVCMTQTICRSPSDNAYNNDTEPETIPEGLYEQLLALAETKPHKKMTKRNSIKPHNKTRRK